MGDEVIREITDKIKSWDGKLIPKAIVTDVYFPDEKKAIDDITVIGVTLLKFIASKEPKAFKSTDRLWSRTSHSQILIDWNILKKN